ncbi:hypothetical protein AAFC00_004357 [Neodothiora populina]
MVSALSAFMEGSSDAWQQSNQASGSTMTDINSARRPSLDKFGRMQPGDKVVRPDQTASLAGDALPKALETPKSLPNTTRASDMKPNIAEDVDCTGSSDDLASISVSSASTTEEDPELKSHGRTVRGTLQTAADLIRTAVDADGVLFLDATISGFGELINSSMINSTPDDDIDTTTSGAEGTEGTGSEADSISVSPSQREAALETSCALLGASYASRNDPEVSHSLPARKLLHSLLRYHKRGKIWNFSIAGGESVDIMTSESYSASDTGSAVLPQDANAGSETSKKRRKRLTKAAWGKDLGQLFPGVRSLMLLGLWDPSRDRWYAGCIIWTYSPIRVFSQEGEMHYLTAFCDVIMAKLGRLDVELANKAKSDFISSISHELRSPLHGILGTVEIMQDQVRDPATSGMITQIEACGRTLLDIVDHLLDFSKINFFAKRTLVAADPAQKGRRSLSARVNKRRSLGGMISVDADVALDQITEEVIETAVYSYCCSKDQRVLSARNLTVIVDIDRSLGVSWRCRVAVGAWKRICVNLVNNALKYTAEGYIAVSLKMLPHTTKEKRPCAQFTVTDSGRGMSKEFLENQLFHAFTQEDDLAEGTGLGMSMVAKIVKGIKGKVDVQSGKGIGTIVTVTVPLELSRPSRQKEPAEKKQKEAQRDLTALAMDVLGPPTPEGQSPTEVGIRLLLKTLRKTCDELGIALSGPSWTVSDASVLSMITEADIPQLLHLLQSAPHDISQEELALVSQLRYKPLVILCNDYMSARRLKKSDLSQLVEGHIEYISQPCGPQRLAIALQTCLSGSISPPFSPIGIDNVPTPRARPNRLSMTMPDFDGSMAYHSDSQGSRTATPLTAIAIPNRPDGHIGVSPGTSILRWNDTMTDDASDTREGSISEYPFPQVPVMTELAEKLADTAISLRKDSQATGQGKRKPGSSIDPSKSCLLLVDDNAINLQLLVAYAKKHGHLALTARDGSEAVETYKTAAIAARKSVSAEHKNSNKSGNSNQTSPQLNTDAQGSPNAARSVKPTVILLDISMPVMNGFEATRHIRAFEHRHKIEPATIVALTGLGSADAQREAYISGVDLFLTKPVRLKELTNLLKDIEEGNHNNEGGKHSVSPRSGDDSG